MSSKKQFFIILAAFFSVVFVFALINYAYDPFGAFDKKGGWYSYRMTRNPRTAKISYLDRHFKNYDAYILGSSGASGIQASSLDHRKFYNLFYYGADMKDIKETAHYILDHYEVKEVLLPITFSFAEKYDTGEGDLHYQMKPELSGASGASFYFKHLFLPLEYVADMRESKKKDSYLPEPFDVFLPESGNYDKRVRSTEYLGSLDEFLEKYPDFRYGRERIPLPHRDEFFRDLQEVLSLFEERGIECKVIMYPLYQYAYLSYEPSEVQDFLDRLSKITDFYDFTYSSVSKEPRFFYDVGHYRNDVGDMMIRKIYGKEGYVPEDFGTFVEKGSSYTISEPEAPDFEKPVKVLMLHHVDDELINPSTITKKKMRELLELLDRKGYEIVRLKDIYNYVNFGEDLPEKPVLLTFDDGYLSNYEVVYPLLKEFDSPAVFFPIGSTVGKKVYKGNREMIPHYSIEEMREMYDSGYVEFGTHSFDMHQSKSLEWAKARTHIGKFPEETEADYIKVVNEDFAKFRELLDGSGIEIRSLAYPLGYHDSLTDVLCGENGIEVSFTTRSGEACLMKGLKQSLLNMNRLNFNMAVDMNEMFP